MAQHSKGADMVHSRRDFLRLSSIAVAASVTAPWLTARPRAAGFTGEVCFFSKHLPQLNWRQVARAAKKIGFTGIDLTVRPGGHVLPARASADLPIAVEQIREEGLSVPMITTGLVSADDPAARSILTTAARLAIPYFKPGYYKYDFVDVRRELSQFGAAFTQLVALGQQAGIQCGFHNHSGNIGASLWDVAQVIDRLEPKWAGYYFDVRHATVEGGEAGWKIALNLVTPRLKMIAIKDFYWEKSPTKGWQTRNCPLGEGMVNWSAYFKILAQAGFAGPISLHLEYDIPGATPAALEDNTLVAAERDLRFLQGLIKEAYGAGAVRKD